MEGRVGKLKEVADKVVALMRSVVALKEDLQAELGEGYRFPDGEGEGSSAEVPSGAAQLCQPKLPHPPFQQLQATSPSKQAVHLGGSGEGYLPVLDAILKNQEAFKAILTNLDTLKDLVGELHKSVSTIEERIQALEQKMSILAQFTQELNQVGDEADWS